MRQKKVLVVAAAAVVLAAGAGLMLSRHAGSAGPATAPRRAQVDDSQIEQRIAEAIRTANVNVRSLVVRKSGDIVVLRGTGDSRAAAAAAQAAKTLGITRVANLITAADPIDDEAIRRDAERTIAQTPALGGCRIAVSCENGVLRVSGTVQHELQKDAARQALRSVSGARSVQLELTKL